MENRRINKVYILGLGALGGLFAAKLHDQNPDVVKVIADRKRAAALQASGLTVNGKLYNFQFISPDATEPLADLILIAVKHPQLQQAIQSVQNFIGEKTTIISLLNGISSEEVIGKAVGMEHLLYAYGVGMDAVRQKTDIQYTNPGKIVFGEKQNITLSERVLAIKNLFDEAEIPNEVPENMLRAMWTKFLLNTGVNQASAVLRAPYEVFHKSEEARHLMLMAAKEVVAISKKCDINLGEADLDNFIKIINSLGPANKTSMLQDIEAARKTEVEIFGGTVIKLGEKYGVPTPVNQVLFNTIRAMEQMQGIA